MGEEVTEQVTEEITQEVTEEVTDDVKSGIDINKASDQIAESLFGPSKDPEKTDDAELEVSELSPEKETDKAEYKLEQKEEIKEPLREAPSSWKKDMRDSFLKLDPEVQDYIELREEQMKNGVDVKKEDADLGTRMRNAMSPYSQLLKSANVDEVEASKRLMATHAALLSASPEQKQQYFEQLAKSYGISQETEEGEVDPKIKQLENQVKQLTWKLQAQENVSQQEQREKISNTVKEFAKEHEYFEELESDIAKLIEAGHSLEDAYNKAYASSSYARQDLEKKIRQEYEEKMKAEKKEAEKAKKAKSVNVKSRDTGKTPTGPLGTMEDTMRDVFRQIQTRT